MTIFKPPCVIIAGGTAQRFGGIDKCLLRLGDKTILSRILDAVAPHVADIALNANGNPGRFSEFGLPVVPDLVADFGPLAGISAGFGWLETLDRPGDWLLVLSSDTPFVSAEVLSRLSEAVMIDGVADIVAPVRNDRRQPLCAFWHRRQADSLKSAVYEGKLRSVLNWCDRVNLREVAFGPGSEDPFFNINTPDDIKIAESMLGKAT